MSQIVKKCPKDGIVYDAAFGGTCESCFGPLQFYCKAHDQWLVDETCNLCPRPAGALPLAPARTEPKGYWVGLAMVALLAVLIGSGWIIWRLLSSPKKPQPVVAPAPTPTPPPPVVPQKPAQLPIELSLKLLLDEPEPFLGKLVKTTGALQFHDPAKQTFDLRQGDYVVQVRYHGTLVAARELTVTGILRRDESLNAIFIVAQDIATR